MRTKKEQWGKKVFLNKKERNLNDIVIIGYREAVAACFDEELYAAALIGDSEDPFYISLGIDRYRRNTGRSCLCFEKPKDFTWDKFISLFERLYELAPDIIDCFKFSVQTALGFNINLHYQTDHETGEKELWLNLYGNNVWGPCEISSRTRTQYDIDPNKIDGYDIERIVQNTWGSKSGNSPKTKLSNFIKAVDVMMGREPPAVEKYTPLLIKEICHELDLRQYPYLVQDNVLQIFMDEEHKLHMYPHDYNQDTVLEELRRNPSRVEFSDSSNFGEYKGQYSLVGSFYLWLGDRIVIGLNTGDLEKFKKANKRGLYKVVQDFFGIYIPDHLAKNKVTLKYEIEIDPGPF